MQPEPSLAPEPQAAPHVEAAKKAPGKFNFLAVILVVLLLAVGFWAFTLGNNLKATQAELATLQGKYDSLSAEKTQLSGDLDQATTDLEATKTELEKAKEELAKAQSDLSKSNEEASALRTKMDKAAQYVAIMKAMFADQDPIATLAKMTEVKDTKLQSLFTQYATTSSADDLQKWLAYIFTTLADLLK